MRKFLLVKTFLSFVFLLFFNSTFCQEAKDRLNKELLAKQGLTTNKIMLYLESGSISLALDYFEKSNEIKPLLEKISEDLKIIRQAAKGGYVVVFDEDHNIFRYRYYTNNVACYLVDLHYNQGSPDSKVVKVVVKEKAVLDKEEKERNESNDVPEPPPMQD